LFFVVGIIVALQGLNISMKNLLLFAFLFFLKAQTIQAQATDHWGDAIIKGNNEVDLNVGFLSGYEIDEYEHSSTKANYFIDGIKVSRPVFLTYKHFISERIAFGLTVGFQTGKGNLVQYVSGNTGHIKYGDFNTNTYTIAPEINFVYKSRPAFRFYGYIGAGITYIDPTYTFDKTQGDATAMYPNLIQKVDYSFQFTPLAWRWGNKFAFCMELGYGYKGIINAGFSYQL
jgi:hypothetical protein